jgi:hypothetical protein
MQPGSRGPGADAHPKNVPDAVKRIHRTDQTDGINTYAQDESVDLSKFTCETYFGGGAIAQTQLFVSDMVFNMNMVLGHAVPDGAADNSGANRGASGVNICSNKPHHASRPDCIIAAFREYAMVRTPFEADLITVIGGCPIDGGSIEMSTQYMPFHEAPRLPRRYVRHGHECIVKMKHASTVIIDRYYSYGLLHGQESVRYFANGAMITEITNPWNHGLLCGTILQMMISSKNGVLYQTIVHSMYTMGNHIQTHETVALYTS